jgi:excisionase family DNA binding protein
MGDRGLYLTTGRVARACGVSLVTVKKWIRQGKLGAFQTPGGHYRVTEGEFRRFSRAYGFGEEPVEGPRVLVVDDDPALAETLVEALRGLRASPKLEVALDGYEGLLKVGTFRPHLLVLDLRMPGTDGFEVCRRIRSDPATRATRILAITAYPEDDARERALGCGADAFLQKPFPLKQLKTQVRRLLER